MLLAVSTTIIIAELAGATVAVTAALTAVSKPLRALTNGHRDSVLAAVAALDEKNTKQHEEGRIARLESEKKSLTAIAAVDGKVEEVKHDLVEVRERAARLEGGQAAIFEGAKQLPTWPKL